MNLTQALRRGFPWSKAPTYVDQRGHEQIDPKAGWVEHDANEIWQNTRAGDQRGDVRPRRSAATAR